MNKKGFTLIELLSVVAIMAILAVVVFVALDPLKRFQDSRDSVRWQQVSELLNALKLDQLDHGGAYLPVVASMGTSTGVYMIGTDVTVCNNYNDNCRTAVSGSTACVNLRGLVDRGYLSSVPVSSNGTGNWNGGHSGYTLQVDPHGAVFIRACENEDSPEIVLSR